MHLFAHRVSTLALGLAVLLVLAAVLPVCGPSMAEAMAMPMAPAAPTSSDCGTEGSMDVCVMTDEGASAAAASRDVEISLPVGEVPATPLPSIAAEPRPVVATDASGPPAHLTPLRI